MLGRTLEDPQGVEGGGSMHGMGLLPAASTFSRKKLPREQKCCRKRISLTDFMDGSGGVLWRAMRSIWGPAGERASSTVEGRVLGTYLHGLFDSGAFTCGLVDLLLDEKGVEWNGRTAPDRGRPDP